MKKGGRTGKESDNKKQGGDTKNETSFCPFKIKVGRDTLYILTLLYRIRSINVG
jgi:hypothetical protein